MVYTISTRSCTMSTSINAYEALQLRREENILVLSWVGNGKMSLVLQYLRWTSGTYELYHDSFCALARRIRDGDDALEKRLITMCANHPWSESSIEDNKEFLRSLIDC